VADDVVLDIGRDDKIIGMEIIDASTHVALEKLLPIHHKGFKASA
jgi:uncharacterized protein YuzE